MQALRLNEVLTRVVAWHNRHPLARRISATQVHSIGEVVLPFASAQVAAAPPAPSALPAMQDLLDPAAAALADLQAGAAGAAPAAQATADTAPAAASVPTGPQAEPGADAAAQADLPDAADDAPAEPAPVLSMTDEADDLFSHDPPPAGEPAASPDDGPEMLVELSSDPDEPAPEFSATDAESAALAAAFAAATDLDAAPQAPAATAAAVAAAPDIDLPADAPSHPAPGLADAVPADPATLPATAAPAPKPAAGPLTEPLAGVLARLLARIKGWRSGSAAGLPRLQATFSRDFIWPLRPGQVARWARRHGSVLPLAPADWPQRLIDTDAALLAQARRQGLPQALPLHLLTAAIGVGDRRIRVLVDAQGRILGPRSYSPPRLAALASLVALGLVGAGWGWLPPADSLSAKQASAAVAAAASAAAHAASSAELAAAAASAADRVWRAQQTGSMPEAATPGDALRADAPLAEAPSADAHPVEAAQHESHQAAGPATAHTAAASNAPSAAPAADPADAPAQRQAALPLGSIVPVLSAADKLAARQQVEAARQGQAAALALLPPQPATPVFAVVTRPTREKDSAARGLALIRASGQRLAGDLPENGELVLNQGEWRAAWWPFESLADAERARVMLAARGLKVEVVEF